MIRALIQKTGACLAVATLLVSSQSSVQADVMDAFDDLQPVSTWFDGCAPQASTCDAHPQTTWVNTTVADPGTPAPLMIGDSLGVPFSVFNGPSIMNFPNFYSKVADNNSAVPQDRAYLTFQYFNDQRFQIGVAPIFNQQRDLQLYTAGIEKTFADGLVSAEVIVPFSYSPSPQFNFGTGVAPASQLEFQNVAFGLKAALLTDDTTTVSAGVRIEAPTAADFQDPAAGGEFHRDAWKVTPYLAMLHYLSDDTFVQAFTAYRFVTTEEWVTFAAIPLFSVREAPIFNMDVQLGHWLYRDNGGSGLTGLQAKVELHYNATFQPVAPGINGIAAFGTGENDALNLTTGLTALFGNSDSITVGLVTPIRNGSPIGFGGITAPSDRGIDYEIAIQYNHYLGN